MKERPILFSAPMVRAILDGSKTQTRRVVKPRADKDMGPRCVLMPHEIAGEVNGGNYRNAYAEPGDRLWVREAWADLTATHGRRWERLNTETQLYERGTHPFVWYRADGDQPDTGGGGDVNPERWRPSIHMPRWASRITLEVTGVRVDRLQDISDTDCLAEGIALHPNHHGKPRNNLCGPYQTYRDLWESRQ